MEMERALLEGEQRNEVAELRTDHCRIEQLKDQEKNKSEIEHRQYVSTQNLYLPIHFTINFAW